MNLKIVISALFFFVNSALNIYSQAFINPNTGLRSHETLGISKVVVTAQKTEIFLSIENKIAGGYFCADKDIFIIYPDGTRNKLISSIGIPVCPETYKFKTIGEKLSFKLTFSPLKKDTQWIDLVEDCTDNCFSFYGVCLNNDLNKRIDDASVLAENGEPAKASVSFIEIANDIDNKNSGIEGLIYMNIIILAKETGNIQKATEWYLKLNSSNIPRHELFIKHLNSQGIIF
jgi:hypothetical protein